MRNLRQYPITDEEILRLIDTLREEELKKTDQEQVVGDIRAAVLRKLSMRYRDLLAIEHEVNNSF
jgi:hypothetical protein